ncbi:MAG TPA: NAD-dependent epimerase/dehydratase family protein, partial [Actinopolymorphaceae bacterium]
GSEEALETALSEPSPGLLADLRRLDGDILVLGAGGKMGPSLCHLARRALDACGRTSDRVVAVSRWTDAAVEKRLRSWGVETLTFDLSPASASASLPELPDAANVIFMVGAKFGSSGQPSSTWAVNSLLPALVAQRYSSSRVAAFSTGNVYPLVSVDTGGSLESDPPDPVGEYAMSCLGRERLLAYVSETSGTPASLLRLNYAIDLRYGVLADIGRAVWEGHPVDVTTGHVNVVWQGYANEVALRSLTLASSPPCVLNVTGPETARVRRIAERFGELFSREPKLTGTEAPTALLSNASRCHGIFGYPSLSLDALITAQADWIRSGGTLWDKPTKFQRRDGRF